MAKNTYYNHKRSLSVHSLKNGVLFAFDESEQDGKHEIFLLDGSGKRGSVDAKDYDDLILLYCAILEKAEALNAE